MGLAECLISVRCSWSFLKNGVEQGNWFAGGGAGLRMHIYFVNPLCILNNAAFNITAIPVKDKFATLPDYGCSGYL